MRAERMYINSMDIVKLRRFPRLMLSLLATAVLALGLATVGCNDNDDDTNPDKIAKVTILIPISQDSSDVNSAAPEDVVTYGVSAYNANGACTYSDTFRRKDCTKDNVSTIEIGETEVNYKTTGIPQSTTTILVTYSNDTIFQGYTLFTGVHLGSRFSSELKVDNVILRGKMKNTEAMVLNLTTDNQVVNINNETESDVISGQTVQLKAALSVKSNPGSEDSVTSILDVTDNVLTAWTLGEQHPDVEGETVLEETADPGLYSCVNGGSCEVKAEFAGWDLLSATTNVTVVDVTIIGNVSVIFSDDALAELGLVTGDYVQLGDDEEDKWFHFSEEDKGFVITGTHTITEEQTATFYSQEDKTTPVATATLPAYKITTQGETIEVHLGVDDIHKDVTPDEETPGE